MELRAQGAGALSGRRLAAAFAAAAAVCLVLPPLAAGDEDLKIPRYRTKPPKGYELTVVQVERIARRAAAVREQKRLHPKLSPTSYTREEGDWQVSWFAHDEELAQVIVDDESKAILEQWTGPQVAWRMARGYPGAFGRKVNAPYVWLPLCLLFLAPFVDPRRPFRMVHLDLLVLLAFGVSHFFFNRGEISASAPLAYPVLGYLLVRLLWLGARARERRERLVPYVPIAWLALGVLFLVGFRIALNVADSNVIDVGYAGVIGADRIADGDELYGKQFHDDVGSGDTYGPVNYLAYLPFEQALSWSGRWDGLPAAHAAAIAFDLLTLLGLFFLGRRLRRGGPGGDALGVALAYAWAAYPYSLFALNSNANDALVGALVVWTLVAASSPAARGALVAVAGLSKFAPLVLAPLLLRNPVDASPGRRRGRIPPIPGPVMYAIAFAGTAALLLLPFVPDGGLREIYDRTLAYQLGRESPFSIWGQLPSLAWLQTAVKAAAVVLALVVAVVPRRRTVAQMTALAGAVLIAFQLGITHWFYLYVVWFAPVALAAFLARVRDPAPEPAPTPPVAAGPPQPVPA